MELSNQINKILDLKQTPKRIVSLVPSQTELLFDLGLENNIVGITKFCVHPYHLKQTKEIVGGTKNIKIDKIKALNPDIILCNKEENTKEIVETCLKIAPVHVSELNTIDDTLELIQFYGEKFSCRTEAAKIIQKINFKLNDFKTFIKSIESKKVAYFIWKDPWMVAGNNTYINHLLQLNKFVNIYQNKERYPEIELKKIRLEGDPDLVFLSSEPYPFKEEHAFEIGRYTHHAKTVFVDGEMFSWHGSRLIKALDYFKKLHHRIV
ncbi:ABC-type Fe3+-hydroxamate transport system substrate-binding protein [Tenacibaculum adriaticum]|uniref:ABC-type Fe3+-hydroxamate transport system substrate-binding protein n=1 Tax=Tenacibaculum adriaticum TaxID=413713 RepID=A0A5S5DSW2_9FLAO|nr:helical backbone metal receptor [Tenacibaculum adriaticum]TYP97952.1 ABC-type Fe3+-hydroxamate transport system substrate-binding protein [Tenacibaculum adriaticum]